MTDIIRVAFASNSTLVKDNLTGMFDATVPTSLAFVNIDAEYVRSNSVQVSNMRRASRFCGRIKETTEATLKKIETEHALPSQKLRSLHQPELGQLVDIDLIAKNVSYYFNRQWIHAINGKKQDPKAVEIWDITGNNLNAYSLVSIVKKRLEQMDGDTEKEKTHHMSHVHEVFKLLFIWKSASDLRPENQQSFFRANNQSLYGYPCNALFGRPMQLKRMTLLDHVNIRFFYFAFPCVSKN